MALSDARVSLPRLIPGSHPAIDQWLKAKDSGRLRIGDNWNAIRIIALFAKELVARNFAGSPPGDLLERLIELTLYSEENLK